MNIRKVVTKALMATAISGALAVIPMTLDGSAATAHADSVNWDAIAQCESGGNWATNSGNGYYGGLQFNLGTWQSNGGTGYPHQNSKAEQIRVATNLYNARGSSPWPLCGRYLP